MISISVQPRLRGICGAVSRSARMDKSYISNPVFIEYAEELAKKFGIPFQETVRRGGSTNAGKISLTAKAVPVLVLGVRAGMFIPIIISVRNLIWKRQQILLWK